jgi:hypothetical protein
VIVELEGKLDVNQHQMRAGLEILGDANVPPERPAARLVEISRALRHILATIPRLRP